MSGRAIIEKRPRIFLGCEGESEQGYGAYLQKLSNGLGRRVHLRQVNLQPAGDPLALAEKAVKICLMEEKKGGFAAKVIILDSDRLHDSHDRGRRAMEILRSEDFITIWQQPDHEALLLRHFPAHEHDDPPRGTSQAALRAVWPGYHKNMSAVDLESTLSLAHVRRAAAVVPELRQLLELIGIG